MKLRRFAFVVVLLCTASGPRPQAAEPVARLLPPPGIEIPAEQQSQLAKELAAVRAQFEPLRDQPLAPDVEVFLKAVELALHFGEFYAANDPQHARELLRVAAEERLPPWAKGQTPWTTQHGRVVRGYRSRIDGSVQPYGLVIPADLDLQRPVPLYVWLHGRSDKQTDWHFLRERMTRDGQIQPPGAIVLHPFGRHCLGFKSAGEIDILEAIDHVRQQYRIDSDRIVLMGFSMGGAGAWHVGAHYTDRFAAISPGAGFAETAQYNNLRPERYPPIYEQQLWGIYDVPDYVRNLFNRPVIAYSGEIDKQIQAARIMEQAYQSQGRKMTHIIGPGMGHKYHPDSLAQILDQLAKIVAQGRPPLPEQVALQTRTLRYHRMDWVEALRLSAHWQEARVDADRSNPRQLKITTRNVTALRISLPAAAVPAELLVDGQAVSLPGASSSAAEKSRPIELIRDGNWRLAQPSELSRGLAKRPGLQGPIDDLFLEPFLVVVPSGHSSPARVQQWVEAELAHFQERWRAVFRGELRVKMDRDVTAQDLQEFHLVAWGTPESNTLLQRALSAEAGGMPVRWNQQQLQVGERSWSTDTHVPVFIYPNPLHPQKYLVVNSGPTFREGHDRTNSLQNPKLPDWAIIDLAEPPSATSPGRIAAADFFDEQWRVK